MMDLQAGTSLAISSSMAALVIMQPTQHAALGFHPVCGQHMARKSSAPVRPEHHIRHKDRRSHVCHEAAHPGARRPCLLQAMPPVPPALRCCWGDAVVLCRGSLVLQTASCCPYLRSSTVTLVKSGLPSLGSGATRCQPAALSTRCVSHSGPLTMVVICDASGELTG